MCVAKRSVALRRATAWAWACVQGVGRGTPLCPVTACCALACHASQGLPPLSHPRLICPVLSLPPALHVLHAHPVLCCSSLSESSLPLCTGAALLSMPSCRSGEQQKLGFVGRHGLRLTIPPNNMSRRSVLIRSWFLSRTARFLCVDSNLQRQCTMKAEEHRLRCILSSALFCPFYFCCIMMTPGVLLLHRRYGKGWRRGGAGAGLPREQGQHLMAALFAADCLNPPPPPSPEYHAKWPLHPSSCIATILIKVRRAERSGAVGQPLISAGVPLTRFSDAYFPLTQTDIPYRCDASRLHCHPRGGV